MKQLSKLFAAAALCVTSTVFAADLPASGTCGFTMGANFPFVAAANLGETGQLRADVPLNLMGTINFGTKTIKYNENTQTYNGAATTDAQRYVNALVVNSVVYSAVASTEIPGMHVITLNASNKINLIPVNNGKTILMQWFNTSDSHGSLGVCQF